MLDIWLVYWIPVSKGMEDAMSTPRIPPEDCPCGKAQTCYECTHPPSERDKVLNRAEQLEKDMKAAFSRKTGEYNPTSIMLVQQYVKELRQAGEP